MTRSRLMALVVGAAVAFDVAGALAQTTRPGRPANGQQPPQTRPGQGQARPDEDQDQGRDPRQAREMSPEEVQRNLRRLRDMVSGGGRGGGRGGRGGPGGRGGFPGFSGNNGMLMLVMSNEALQEEIQLTEEQKQQLQDFQEQSRDRMREMFQNMRSQGGNNNGRPNFRDPQFQAQMQQNFQRMAQEAQSAYSKILTKDQMVRLNQIRLQIVGPLAVAEPEIAQALMINDQQNQKIQTILAQMDQLQDQVRDSLRQQGGNGGPGAGQRPGQQPGAGNAPNRNAPNRNAPAGNNARQPNRGDDDDDDENADEDENQQRRGRIDPNSPEYQAFRERMNEADEKQEEIRKKAESAIAKVLLSGQKKKFNSMLGKPMELEKLARSTGFGGRGGGDRGRGNRGRGNNN